MRLTLVTILALVAQPLWSQTPDLTAVVDEHILPRYQALADEASDLATAAAKPCDADRSDLIPAYHDAFDAWIGVSHLRFGPSEKDDRAFALAFWPDPRGSTPKTLASLMRDEDPVVKDPTDFAKVSVAARGFYAMEFLLFDAQFVAAENSSYHCALVRAVANDIAANASAILSDWQGEYGALIASPGNDTYRTKDEAAQQIFTAVSTGLEFTSVARLGRPLGTIERPRPSRAEARRSGRSLRHVILSLEATKELTARLTSDREDIVRAFDASLEYARGLNDPGFAGVATPDGRFRVDVLQTQINDLRRILSTEIGPELGVSAGFNSLDGD